MSLTALFVRRPTLVFVLLALMLLAGSIAATTLVQQQYPNVSNPTISVNVSYSGASTTVMRDSIVRPIEDAIAGSPDLQTLSSNIQSGQATISAAFYIQSNVNTDLVNVQKSLQTALHNLPTDLQPPTLSVRDPSQATVVTLSLTSSKLTASQLSLIATGRVVPFMEQTPDISFVTVGGSVTPAYEVVVDPQKLAAANLTLNDVVTTVGGSNTRAPGGIAYYPNRETQIDIRGDIYEPQSILGLPISAPSNSGTISTTSGNLSASAGAANAWTSANQVLRIGDVASVVDGYEPRRQSASVNGIGGLFLQIQKTSDSSEVTASDNVLASLPNVEAQFPDINFNVINVQSKYTAQQIDSVIRTLIEGIILTGLVMLFFLGSWRNMIVVLIAIPASLCVALFVMKMMNLTLDTISLLGMTLVVGILVDDSTVVLENIERHSELGEEPDQAAIKGRSEIGMAAIVITLVDVVVFLPIAFLQGQVGRNLAEFGIVVVISTLTSLFVSFTITPTLAAKWALKGHWKPPFFIRAFSRGFERVRSTYAHRILPWGLRHRVPFVAFCFASLVLAVGLIPTGLVGEEFIPPVDRGEVFLQITYPVGTPLTTVTQAVLKLERQIRTLPDIDADTAISGGYASPFGGFLSEGNVGQVHVWLKDARQHTTDYWVNQYRQIAAKTLPNTQVVVIPATGTGGGNAQPIDELVTDVSGGDPTTYAQQVYQTLLQTPGATNVNSNAAALEPQVELLFDRAKARALNVSIGTATIAARAAFGGAIATQFETADGLEQVQVIYPVQNQTDLTTLSEIPIRATNGQIVHLGDFASFEWSPAPPLITRVDRNTVVDISANFAPTSSLSNVQHAFQQRVAAMHLPKNIVVRPRPLGQQDLMGQTLLGLGSSLILSVALVFLLMVALYNSYLSPLIIMFSVPVAAVGALGALALTHETLNLFSLIGTILLVGIVTKNGILLVDYANTLRDRGEDKLTAIQESAFTRFRPIVMTSISVVAGNIPLALALEPGSSVRASLGVVVIGGILSSLFLTLILVPIMYMWLAPEHFHASHDGEPHGGGNGLPGTHQEALPARA
ncbi:MAG TPA: efflux RND transporter permease subunit [Candidatus Limnocylindria bacterium]|jgi:HAE1 family hydrophobic/amphiphilic exporter-1|nr:efflux RND transporter permease subunit [Candidatus Limnocylindria bacterium]